MTEERKYLLMKNYNISKDPRKLKKMNDKNKT